MLKNWMKFLPFFLVVFISKRYCERMPHHHFVLLNCFPNIIIGLRRSKQCTCGHLTHLKYDCEYCNKQEKA